MLKPIEKITHGPSQKRPLTSDSAKLNRHNSNRDDFQGHRILPTRKKPPSFKTYKKRKDQKLPQKWSQVEHSATVPWTNFLRSIIFMILRLSDRFIFEVKPVLVGSKSGWRGVFVQHGRFFRYCLFCLFHLTMVSQGHDSQRIKTSLTSNSVFPIPKLRVMLFVPSVAFVWFKLRTLIFISTINTSFRTWVDIWNSTDRVC